MTVHDLRAGPLTPRCETCGMPFERNVTQLGDSPPRAGDIALCGRCLEPSVFTMDAGVLGARTATCEDLAKLGDDELKGLLLTSLRLMVARKLFGGPR